MPGPALCRPCRFALAGPLALAIRSGRRRVIDCGDGPEAPIVATTYQGRARQVIRGFKFGNRRRLAGHLAGLVVNAVVAAGARVDAVTWAPTSRRHAGDRGFDQAELVAGHVARQLGVPCVRLLQRTDEHGQVGRSRADRLERRGLFVARRPVQGRILVVDDVVTTGATLREAVDALWDAGADAVVPAAVAGTPARHQVAANRDLAAA